MDVERFGAFVAAMRKERKMTQAELAAKLQVTDKAVSRWERGVGFPDIQSLESLADALGITLLELMRSERYEVAQVTAEEASQALADTVHTAQLQWHQRMKRIVKRIALVMAACILITGLWMVFTGLMPRTDVFLYEYAVLPSGGAITLHVGIAGSMGYVRSCVDVSDDPTRMELQFYSAFGGLNSRLGAQNVFTLPLDEAVQSLCFRDAQGFQTVLIRDEATGMWERVPRE